MSLHSQSAFDDILFDENRLIVFIEALEAFRVGQKDSSFRNGLIKVRKSYVPLSVI